MQKQIGDLIQTLCKNQRLSKFAVSESGFLFDPVTGQSFTLNQTGLLTFNRLKTGESIADTAAFLANEYDVSRESALASVEAFLIQLGRII
jgi:hypothetical protein